MARAVRTGLPAAAKPQVAQASCLPVQRLPASSIQLSTLNCASIQKHVGPDKNTRKNTRWNTLKRPKNTQNTEKTRSFFYERRNVNCHATAPAR
jgi:hypothetical protein